jgi:hypothetical protein
MHLWLIAVRYPHRCTIEVLVIFLQDDGGTARTPRYGLPCVCWL